MSNENPKDDSAQKAGGVGIACLVIGAFLHYRYGPSADLCKSSIGALGQALSTRAHTGCSTAEIISGSGTALIVVGVIVLVVAVIGLLKTDHG